MKEKDKYCYFAPIKITKEWLEEKYKKKMLVPVCELENLVCYVGNCRNSELAIWDAEENSFFYLRYKFGDRFIEQIETVESNSPYDVFLPHYKADENDQEVKILKEEYENYEKYKK